MKFIAKPSDKIAYIYFPVHITQQKQFINNKKKIMHHSREKSIPSEPIDHATSPTEKLIFIITFRKH